MNRNRMLFMLAAASITLTAGCNQYEVTVHSHQYNCVGVGPQTCMDTSGGAPGLSSRLFYDGIVGFDYTWCNTHTLLVHDEPRVPMADGPSTVTVLDAVISTEFDEGNTFQNTLHPGWQMESSGAFVPYHCADGDEALCAELNETLGDEVNDDGSLNEQLVDAEFECVAGSDSPRLIAFEPFVNPPESP